MQTVSFKIKSAPVKHLVYFLMQLKQVVRLRFRQKRHLLIGCWARQHCDRCLSASEPDAEFTDMNAVCEEVG